MKCGVQAIQVDFDDGHCPSWSKQLMSWKNIRDAVRGQMGIELSSSPILLIRPRAWNMLDNHVSVDGKPVHGTLVDFAIHMSHNAAIMHKVGVGPWFFVSKTESAFEAGLWDDIFTWTEARLGLPHGSIKAHVLIENILASFEMEEILYSMKDHSLGLNCGVWDYSASIISLFGSRKEFMIPDRGLYVNMQKHFLKSYMDLVVHTSHKRGAPATGGMVAVVPNEQADLQAVTANVCAGKAREITAGVDGFLFFDLKFKDAFVDLWQEMVPDAVNQMGVMRPEVPGNVAAKDLLTIPSGGVTLNGLKNNIAVGIHFIQSWILKAEGHFIFNGQVEDSATAEISRSQVWQWIRHGVSLEDDKRQVTKSFVQELICEYLTLELSDEASADQHWKETLKTAANVFERLVTTKYFPQFITTYLNEESAFNLIN